VRYKNAKMDGVELFEAVKKIKPEIPSLWFPVMGVETAINTMRMGFDYISKRLI
jgi:DNA-binding NtrC family response regulator